ncbi:hypothetical protein DRZ78_01745 [Candidatus Aerophobetes bacterium]|uniref:Uncharacterized protein n=1 Tax=Aerophobetes bacterium TaxID=2030807 RepID=A0A662D0X9_UNCAE|nr:MAG: hypothetical protein DRZ78_01745 [Candidatus Aerophobetes bacterium]
MSTRAVVQIDDGEEKWSIYCHGDGHPRFIGKRVYQLVQKAPIIDPNFHSIETPPPSYNNPKSHQNWAPNVAIHSDRFCAVLLGELWEDYGGAYLTKRDPEKEIKEDWTDIEHLYKVKLCGSSNHLKTPKFSWWTPNKKKFVKHTKQEFLKEITGGENE